MRQSQSDKTVFAIRRSPSLSFTNSSGVWSVSNFVSIPDEKAQKKDSWRVIIIIIINIIIINNNKS